MIDVFEKQSYPSEENNEKVLLKIVEGYLEH